MYNVTYKQHFSWRLCCSGSHWNKNTIIRKANNDPLYRFVNQTKLKYRIELAKTVTDCATMSRMGTLSTNEPAHFSHFDSRHRKSHPSYSRFTFSNIYSVYTYRNVRTEIQRYVFYVFVFSICNNIQVPIHTKIEIPQYFVFGSPPSISSHDPMLAQLFYYIFGYSTTLPAEIQNRLCDLHDRPYSNCK